MTSEQVKALIEFIRDEARAAAEEAVTGHSQSRKEADARESSLLLMLVDGYDGD